MPALNINFTREELDRLRNQARTQGVSLTTLAHDTIVQVSTAAAVRDEAARTISLSRDLLRRLAEQ